MMMKLPPQKRNFSLVLALCSLIIFSGCNANSSKNKYTLGEKFLEDRKYEAAISEFQDVVDKEAFTDTGKSALLKIAQIQHLYLGRGKEAEANYELFLKRNKDEKLKAEVDKTLATLSYEIFEDYEKAIERYTHLISAYPTDPNIELYYFNIARSYFLLSKFDDAKKSYEDLQLRFPTGRFSKKAALEVANGYAAKGNCKEAIKQFTQVEKMGDPALVVLAKFGAASCYEEMGDLDEAYEIFGQIRDKYPTPSIVDLKMSKIKRRKILRRR